MMMTTASSGLTASSATTAACCHRQELLASSLRNITGVDTAVATAMTTVANSLGRSARTSLLVSSVRILLVSICTAGVLFNGFVLFVLVCAKRSRRVSSKMLIVNQTLADLFVATSIHRRSKSKKRATKLLACFV